VGADLHAPIISTIVTTEDMRDARENQPGMNWAA
jgi:hypothetical protein